MTIIWCGSCRGHHEYGDTLACSIEKARRTFGDAPPDVYAESLAFYKLVREHPELHDLAAT